MFGKVQEDSFQSIFDLSLDDNTFDSKSLNQQGLGLGRNSRDLVASLISLQTNQTKTASNTWGNALFQLPEEKQTFDQQKMVDSNISSPTSSTHSLPSKSFDFGLESDSSSTSSTTSSTSSKNVNSSRYKTELCRPFQENGTCKYGEKCQFAHGYKELRTVSRHPKYKTDLCRTYHSSGFCPYGPRCHFIHNLDEQQPATKNKVAQGANAGANGANRDDKEPVVQLPIFQSRRTVDLNDHQEQSPKAFPVGETASGEKQPIRSEAVAQAGQGYPAGRLPVFSTLFH